MPTLTTPARAGDATQPQAPISTPIDNDPNKFVLYGITYLMATPGVFSTDHLDDQGTPVKAIVHQGDSEIAQFLTDAGVKPAAIQPAIDFAKRIDLDPTLQSVTPRLHLALQANFGPINYSPLPCPKREDAVKIMRAMAVL